MFLPAEQVSDSELDEQQAQLLDVLRRFGGKPVSYQQLRDAGIEYPASVVSELELAGLPLERAYEGSLSARRLLGVRLDPRYDRVDAQPLEMVEVGVTITQHNDLDVVGPAARGHLDCR